MGWPSVGVGVFVTSAAHPACVLLLRQPETAGAAAVWGLPGGPLRGGEAWELCAERTVYAQAGLRLCQLSVSAVLNVVLPESHTVLILMRGAVEGEPPHAPTSSCEGWEWTAWGEPLAQPLAAPLATARARGVDPFAEGVCAIVTQPPRYCCAILRDPSGALLLEARPPSASVAGGELTCFGGKREPGEEPLACLLRECREELGWAPHDAARAVDLYVDGALVAFFFTASAPPRAAPLRLEPGRRAVWMDDVRRTHADGVPLSPWHACVLRALQAGDRRADFCSEPGK
ncbi:hypothetical protein AB1Y20_018493 [Prymnesium parvum]|uniref:Nudix hydrolase domain-containing protein n=1 Tax=Prymnesium parvum TaxID=97485 RepID=A0AB34JR35_PRYPA